MLVIAPLKPSYWTLALSCNNTHQSDLPLTQRRRQKDSQNTWRMIPRRHQPSYYPYTLPNLLERSRGASSDAAVRLLCWRLAATSITLPTWLSVSHHRSQVICVTLCGPSRLREIDCLPREAAPTNRTGCQWRRQSGKISSRSSVTWTLRDAHGGLTCCRLESTEFSAMCYTLAHAVTEVLICKVLMFWFFRQRFCWQDPCLCLRRFCICPTI
jgi:hypothetical protein